MRIGAIDVGTNSTRLLVVEKQDKVLHRLWSDLKTTRIGEGINSGVLQEPAMARTVEAIKAFQENVDEFKVDKLIIGATSAVRDAVNGEEFVSLVKKETGLDLLIIPGELEAELSYLGVVHDFASFNDIGVLDIGGGSTEIIWRENAGLVCTSSKVGAVRMTEANSNCHEIKNLLNQVLTQVQKAGINNFIGVGGTITTLAAIKQKLQKYNWRKIHGFVLEYEDVQNIYNDLLTMDLNQRQLVPGLQKERADIILAGIMILLVIMQELKIKKIMVSESDILHGMALYYS